MKTKRMSRVGMVLFAVLCAGTSLFAAAPVLYDNFNTETLGSPPSGWTCSAPANTSCAVSNFAGDRAVVFTDNTTTGSCSITKTFTARANAFSAQWNFKVAAPGKRTRFLLYSGNTIAIDIRVWDDNSLSCVNGSGVVTSIMPGIQGGVWYKLQVIADPATDLFAVYVDGILKAQGLPFNTPVASLDKIYFSSGFNFADTLYIDNVVVDQTEYYVAPTGNDANPGTSDLPFATIARARDVVRSLAPWTTTNLTVWLRGGVYAQTNTLAFSPADSGCNDHQIIYKAYPGEEPVISGGYWVTGWTDQGGGLWRASMPPSWTNYFRHLWVNGFCKKLAATEQPLTMQGFQPDGNKTNIVFYTATLPALAQPADAVLKIVQSWVCNYIPIDAMTDLGGGRTAIQLQSPGEEIYRFAAAVSGAEPFHIENDRNLCDMPGEWWYDKSAQQLYYRPEPGENMTTAEVYAPGIEKLITLYGASPGAKIGGVVFKDITFAHTSWVRPATEVTQYANGTWLIHPDVCDVPVVDYDPNSEDYANWAVVPAAVCLNYAQDIAFDGCTFRNLGAVALGGYEGVIDCDMVGNAFYDIGNTAMHFGYTKHNETDKPGEETCKRIAVRNNVITHVGVTDWGAPAIQTGFVEGFDISHNDISFVAYCGIRMGATLNKYPNSTNAHDNLIADNKIREVMVQTFDGAPIYTQARNEGTVISGNYLTACNSGFGIYHDAGSAGYRDCSNVVDQAWDRWININDSSGPTNHPINVVERNFFTTGTVEVVGLRDRNVVTNNTALSGAWPAAAIAITNHAGLEPAYAAVFSRIPTTAIAARYIVDPALLSVAAPSDATVALSDGLRLVASVAYPSLLTRPIHAVWSKESTPSNGVAAFNHGNNWDADVGFNLPGTYTLKLTAGPGRFWHRQGYYPDPAFSRTDTMTVVITNLFQSWMTNNVALGMLASASSVYQSNTGHSASCAVDGQSNTLWASDWYTKTYAWWQVDLGSPRVPRRIEELARSSVNSTQHRYAFRILGSTTSNFTSYTVLAQQDGRVYPHEGTWVQHLTNNTAFRYIRRELMPPANKNENTGMAEFRVFALPPPGLAVIGNKTNNAGSLVTFTAAITNADPYMTYSYTLGTGAPAGAAIDAVTGVFTWTPPLTQVPGDYAFTVRVTDSGGQYSEQTITVTVKAPGLGLLFRLN